MLIVCPHMFFLLCSLCFVIVANARQFNSCYAEEIVTPTSNFQPIRLLDLGSWYKFKYWMANSADPDQKPTDLDLHCLQRQGISRHNRKWVNLHLCENSGQSVAPDKRGIHIIVFLFLHENICLGYSLESEVLLMSTITDVFVEK